MIYKQESNKFQSYLRALTKQENVQAAYDEAMRLEVQQRLRNINDELKEHYSDWEYCLPKLAMDFIDRTDASEARAHHNLHC